ncbi:MAG: BrnA antitoxin family protein [Thiohalomonadales bacterium]
MNDDFTTGKRGAVLKSDPNKIRITIRLDGDIIEHFKNQVHSSGGGNYQTLINDALRDYIHERNESLEETIRKVIREELKQVS